MRNITTVFSTSIFITAILLFTSCEDWVSEVDPLSDQVEDGDLTTAQKEIIFSHFSMLSFVDMYKLFFRVGYYRQYLNP